MLEIIIPGSEFWDPNTEEFRKTKDYTLRLEHSLISISKWEAKWKKAFLNNKNRTEVEMLDYIRCMSISGDPPVDAYIGLNKEHIEKIREYIDDRMTATFVYHPPGSEGAPRSQDKLTSEVIYYQMISYGIPVQFEKWHINRLLTLIDVFNVKNSKQKKRPIGEILRSNAALNAKRRAELGTTG